MFEHITIDHAVAFALCAGVGGIFLWDIVQALRSGEAHLKLPGFERRYARGTPAFKLGLGGYAGVIALCAATAALIIVAV